MSGVIIGVDPHKASATIEVRDEREMLRATGRFGADTGGYRAMLRYCRQWPARTWAVEGANGTGRPLSARLLGAMSARPRVRASARPARRAAS
jgi:transposase